MSNPVMPTLPASDDDARPLPLIVADNWQFPLAHVETPEGVYYAIQDWIKGLVNVADARKLWSDMQFKNVFFQLSDSIRQLPYTLPVTG
jgi:hypothetical protein